MKVEGNFRSVDFPTVLVLTGVSLLNLVRSSSVLLLVFHCY